MAVVEVEGKASPLAFLTDNAIAAAFNDTWGTLSEKRRLMGLDNPGTVDGIAREVQRDVLLSNHMFSGLRCDLQKVFSLSPLFRLQHGFAMGSQALPPWQLMALYGSPRVCHRGSSGNTKY
jgi:mitochondrial import receptor subunit TOM40